MDINIKVNERNIQLKLVVYIVSVFCFNKIYICFVLFFGCGCCLFVFVIVFGVCFFKNVSFFYFFSLCKYRLFLVYTDILLLLLSFC